MKATKAPSTKEAREERWKACAKYIRRTSTLSEARELAKRDGVQFNTSVWITALGKILSENI